MPPSDLHQPAARRRLYIRIAQKRVRPGSGSGPETLWARTWRQPVFEIRTILSVPFVIVGGVATRLYAPERMTDDLDVLIEESCAEKLSEELRGTGCRVGGRLAVGAATGSCRMGWHSTFTNPAKHGQWRLLSGRCLDRTAFSCLHFLTSS